MITCPQVGLSSAATMAAALAGLRSRGEGALGRSVRPLTEQAEGGAVLPRPVPSLPQGAEGGGRPALLASGEVGGGLVQFEAQQVGGFTISPFHHFRRSCWSW